MSDDTFSVRYFLNLDSNNTVVGVACGNADHDGWTEVDQPTYQQCMSGSWTYVGGTLSTFVPSPVSPYNTTQYVTGRQINGQMIVANCSVNVINWIMKVGQVDSSGKPIGAKPDDYHYWKSIGLDTNIPIDNPKVGRILSSSGVVNSDGSSAVPAFMQAAIQLPT